jgi:predicted HAD superfamily Cof-like phosphohydrolase
MKALREWHRAVGEKRFVERSGKERDALIALRAGLIQEEWNEVVAELLAYGIGNIVDESLDGGKSSSLEALAKELADLLYVIYGTADLLDIPLEAVFAEVHRSNMSKIGPDGEVLRRADGKILKSATYREADVHGAMTGSWR